MKINATKFYTVLFVIVVFAQLYLPSFKANTFLQIGVLMVYGFFEKITISKTIFDLLKYLVVIVLIGFIGTLLDRYALFNISKDIFHFIKPILGILIGYFFYKKINNFKIFVKTIVLIGFLSALIHFGIILFFSRTDTVSDLREFGKDNFLELFALLFLSFYKKFQGENLFIHKLNYRILFFTLLLSCIFYFSRTMIVVAIITLLSIYGYTIITKRMIRTLGICIIAIGLLYAYLFSVKIDRNKSGIESFLYKVKIAPSELFKTKIDRENHKDLWDHWRGYEAKRALALMADKPSSIVFGTGFGSLVNLKFKAPLTGDDKGIKYISELHNGYIYILYKIGIFGIIIQFLFFIALYRFIYKSEQRNFIVVFVSAIGLLYFFTTLTITGIYNTKDVIIFILGALLFFEKDLNLKLNQTTNG